MTPEELRDLREAQPSWMQDGKGLRGDNVPRTLRRKLPPRSEQIPSMSWRDDSIDEDQTCGDILRRDPQVLEEVPFKVPEMPLDVDDDTTPTPPSPCCLYPWPSP